MGKLVETSLPEQASKVLPLPFTCLTFMCNKVKKCGNNDYYFAIEKRRKKNDLPGLDSVGYVLNQISDNFMLNVIQHPHS